MNLSKKTMLSALLAAECFDPTMNQAFMDLMKRGSFNGKRVKDILRTPRRLASFLAQLSYESAGLTRLEENCNYSPERAIQVFRTRITDLTHAELLCRDPKDLMNHVYNGRMGNRLGSYDGWDYRGRGFIMLTGSDNYKAFQNFSGLAVHEAPCLLLNPKVAFAASLYFFSTQRSRGKNLLELADDNHHRLISRKINGGRHGLTQRLTLTRRVVNSLDNNFSPSTEEIVSSSSRKELKEAQYLLKELGYYKYSIDGYWGPGTSKACQTFVYDNRLRTCDLFNLHEQVFNT